MASIALLTGEPSGDLQAAAVAKALRSIAPELQLWGTGGRHLRSVGVEIVEDTSALSVVGLFEAVPTLKTIWDTYQRMRERLAQRRPDLTVMVDTPAVNMRLADLLRQEGLRSLYYFPPSAWTTNLGRLAQIHSKVDAVVPSFRFNASNYKKAGLEHAFFGHPMVDLFQPKDMVKAQRELDVEPGRTYVALLPGSRVQEIRHILPLFLEVSRRLHRYRPDLHFLLPVASPSIRPLVEEVLGRRCLPHLTLLDGQSRRAMSSSRLAFIASGSATLEAALLEIPMVLCYRANAFDYHFGQTLRRTGILKIHRWGLPNIVLGRDVMPELLQDEANPAKLVELGLELLDSSPTRQRQLDDFKEIRRTLGPEDFDWNTDQRPNVVGRVARFVYEFSRGATVEQAKVLADRQPIHVELENFIG